MECQIQITYDVSLCTKHESLRTGLIFLTIIARMSAFLTVQNIVLHNTSQNSSDNVVSYPPDHCYSSNVAYWSRGDLNVR